MLSMLNMPIIFGHQRHRMRLFAILFLKLQNKELSFSNLHRTDFMKMKNKQENNE